jgi:hypothetical protein
MIVLHLNTYQSVIFAEISVTKNLMSIYTSGRLKQALVILLVTRKNTTVKATRGKFDKRTHSLSLSHNRLSCRNYWWNHLVSPNTNFLSQKQYAARMIRQSGHSRPRLQAVYARHEKLSIPWLKDIKITHSLCDNSQTFYTDVESITASMSDTSISRHNL